MFFLIPPPSSSLKITPTSTFIPIILLLYYLNISPCTMQLRLFIIKIIQCLFIYVWFLRFNFMFSFVQHYVCDIPSMLHVVMFGPFSFMLSILLCELHNLSILIAYGKGPFLFQSQRKTMLKNVQTTVQLHSFHTLAK